jgi:hypothetical protein
MSCCFQLNIWHVLRGTNVTRNVGECFSECGNKSEQRLHENQCLASENNRHGKYVRSLRPFLSNILFHIVQKPLTVDLTQSALENPLCHCCMLSELPFICKSERTLN